MAIQTQATQARTAWQRNTQTLTTNEGLNIQIAMMKLNKTDAAECLEAIKRFKATRPKVIDMTPKQTVQRMNALFGIRLAPDNTIGNAFFHERVSVNKLLLHAPFYDEEYNKNYPNTSLGYPALGILEDRLIKEAEKLSVTISQEYAGPSMLRLPIYFIQASSYAIKEDLTSEPAENLNNLQSYLDYLRIGKIDVKTFSLRLNEWGKEVTLLGNAAYRMAISYTIIAKFYHDSHNEVTKNIMKSVKYS